jgi:hypothetical protein
MKKTLIATTLALAVTAASALEVGVQMGRDFSSPNRNYGGVTLGHAIGPASLTLGYDRTAVTGNDQNRWSLVAGYDLMRVGPVTVTPMLGAAFLDNQTGSDGLAMTAGVGASVPVTNRIRAVVDWTYQVGQNRVNANNGNRITAGVRYTF